MLPPHFTRWSTGKRGERGKWAYRRANNDLWIINLIVGERETFLTHHHLNITPVKNPTVHTISEVWEISSIEYHLLKTSAAAMKNFEYSENWYPRKIHTFKSSDITVCFLHSSEQYFSYHKLPFQPWFMEIQTRAETTSDKKSLSKAFLWEGANSSEWEGMIRRISTFRRSIHFPYEKRRLEAASPKGWNAAFRMWWLWTSHHTLILNRAENFRNSTQLLLKIKP